MEADMAAYLIVEHKIKDPAKFDEYRIKVGPMIAGHGGPYIAKGGTHRVLETKHWLAGRRRGRLSLFVRQSNSGSCAGIGEGPTRRGRFVRC
jgi:hypothetical protein